MSPVSVCSSCGRAIEKQFVYCPWCGQTKVSSFAEYTHMDEVFERLEKLQSDDHINRIEKMESRLDDLQKELDALILCAEMHK